MAKPYVIGLTGSIGMGKTATLKLFAGLGLPTFSADEAVHRLYGQGGGAVPLIAREFPGTVKDGRVDRRELAGRVIGNAAEAARLEAIVHPLVARERARFLEAEKESPIVVLDVPLLFESGAEREMDAIVVASAPAHVQRARVLARPGMNQALFDFLHGRQLADVDKRARAHFVVVTDKGVEHAAEQVNLIVAEIRKRIKDHA